MDSDLLGRTIRHIGEFLERDVSHLTLQSRLDSAVPGLDSLKVFEMMLYLEDCFGVDFDEQHLAQVRTLQDLLTLIEGELAAGQARPVGAVH